MNNDNIFEIFGYIGAFCLSIMGIPQVIHTIKTEKTEDISIKFIVFNLLAICFLLPYSIYFKLYPVMGANFSVCICNLIILYYCIRNQLKNKT
tara:strand:+ start:1023 stop:1301 length:279 start_codon:yes stop_codon:yes gene_type:complete